jgi:hypothetical protein
MKEISNLPPPTAEKPVYPGFTDLPGYVDPFERPTGPSAKGVGTVATSETIELEAPLQADSKEGTTEYLPDITDFIKTPEDVWDNLTPQQASQAHFVIEALTNGPKPLSYGGQNVYVPLIIKEPYGEKVVVALARPPKDLLISISCTKNLGEAKGFALSFANQIHQGLEC